MSFASQRLRSYRVPKNSFISGCSNGNLVSTTRNFQSILPSKELSSKFIISTWGKIIGAYSSSASKKSNHAYLSECWRCITVQQLDGNSSVGRDCSEMFILSENPCAILTTWASSNLPHRSNLVDTFHHNAPQGLCTLLQAP